MRRIIRAVRTRLICNFGHLSRAAVSVSRHLPGLLPVDADHPPLMHKKRRGQSRARPARIGETVEDLMLRGVVNPFIRQHSVNTCLLSSSHKIVQSKFMVINLGQLLN